MMRTATLIAAGALAFATSLGGVSLAQELTIDGVPVPANELEAVQAKCDELLANRATALAQPDAGAPAADASADAAAGASADVAASAAPAEGANPAGETMVEGSPADTAVAEAPAGGAAPAADAAAAAGAAATIDIETLTADLCEAGGFEPSMD